MISLNMHELSDWRDTTSLQILEEVLDKEMKEVDFNIIPLLYTFIIKFSITIADYLCFNYQLFILVQNSK